MSHDMTNIVRKKSIDFFAKNEAGLIPTKFLQEKFAQPKKECSTVVLLNYFDRQM